MRRRGGAPPAAVKLSRSGLGRAMATAGLVAALAASCVPQAEAHGEANPFVRAVIDRTSPAPGLTVSTARASATLIQARNDSDRELEILSDRGEPFLRIGRDGVFANVSSVEWYASGNPDGVADVPPAIRGRRLPPRWIRASRDPGWSWFDHRLHPRALTSLPPSDVRTTVRLFDWRVPARLGGRPAAIEGHVEYRPVFGRVVASLRDEPDPSSGLVVQVTSGLVPALFVQNGGRRPVTVLGRDGEPFARIGPRGAEVNVRSATHLDAQRLRGATPAAAADPRARPRWRRVDRAPQYAWLESRARYGPEQPPDGVLRRLGPTVLTNWVVPVRSAAGRRDVRGSTSWVPFTPPGRVAAGDGGGGADLLALAVLAAGAGAAIALVSMLRRRRSRQTSSG